MKNIRNYYGLGNPEHMIPTKGNVVIIDSGISMHPDLKDNIVRYYNFTNQSRTVFDEFGHGTHIAGIIAGDGKCSNKEIMGINPRQSLISLKILDKYGNGNYDNLKNALEWVLYNAERYKVRLINLSININTSNNIKEKQIYRIIEELWENNIVIVTSAGNKQGGIIDGIAAMSQVITVGCYDHQCSQNQIIEGKCCGAYSKNGFINNDYYKPDLLAPGSRIVSCSSVWNKRNAYYVEKSGTSMATAIVTGAISLLINKNDTIENFRIKKLLEEACYDLGFTRDRQGAGLLDINKLLRLQ